MTSSTALKLSSGVMKVFWISLLSTLTINFGFAAEPGQSLFTYVTNKFAQTVSGYSIDLKTGALTPLPGSPLQAEDGPISIAITRN